MFVFSSRALLEWRKEHAGAHAKKAYQNPYSNAIRIILHRRSFDRQRGPGDRTNRWSGTARKGSGYALVACGAGNSARL
jgi:hypothetical protein